MAEIIVCSTHQVPGREIRESKGLVFGTTVRSRGMLGRFLSSITTITGGRAGAYLEELNKARVEAIEDMKNKAKEMGADAVVGIDMDISEVLEGFIMVTAGGTAVKLK